MVVGLAALFAAMAIVAAALHQTAMAWEFATTVSIFLPAGLITLLSRPRKNERRWWNRPIRIDTKRRLVASGLVMCALLVAMYFLIGRLAGPIAAGIEVGTFAIVLVVGFFMNWRRLEM